VCVCVRARVCVCVCVKLWRQHLRWFNKKVSNFYKFIITQVIFLDLMHIFNSNYYTFFMEASSNFSRGSCHKDPLWFQMSLFISSFCDPSETLQPYLPLSGIIDVAGSARMILPTCECVRTGTLMILSCEFTFRYYYLLSCFLYV